MDELKDKPYSPFKDQHLLELTRVFASAYNAMPFINQQISTRFGALSAALMQQGKILDNEDKFQKGILFLADYMRTLADALDMAGHGNFDGIQRLYQSMEEGLDKYKSDDSIGNEDDPSIEI